jgi:hypothetical protein
MNLTPFFLADADLDTIMKSWRGMAPETRGVLIVFSAIMLVTLLVVGWAVFIRKRRRRRREHHHSRWHSTGSAEASDTSEDEDGSSSSKKRRRRRRSGRQHRPRNPTLAETGGLPPIRPLDPSDPQP